MKELFNPELPLITDIVGQAALACGFLDRSELPFGLDNSSAQARGVFNEDVRQVDCDTLSFPDAQKLCLVMVDGLGMELVKQRFGHAHFLRTLIDSPDTLTARTCLPSSTACAIPSLTTGYLPGQTGMMGYETLPAKGEPVVNMLQFVTRERKPYHHQSFMRYPTIFSAVGKRGFSSAAAVPQKFLGSAMTDISLAGCELIAAKRLIQRCEIVVDKLRNGADIGYVYWDGIDHTGHKYGWNSMEWEAELEATDSALNWLCTHVPKGTLVVIVADHGMVDVDVNLEVNLPLEAPELLQDVGEIAGEPRALHVHMRPIEGEKDTERQQRRQNMIDSWSTYFGDRAIVVGADDAPQYYGTCDFSSEFTTLYPDMTVFVVDQGSIVHQDVHSPGVRIMKGMHGSITADEVHIPVAVALQ